MSNNYRRKSYFGHLMKIMKIYSGIQTTDEEMQLRVVLKYGIKFQDWFLNLTKLQILKNLVNIKALHKVFLLNIQYVKYLTQTAECLQKSKLTIQ